jgi:hypothetical protein
MTKTNWLLSHIYDSEFKLKTSDCDYTYNDLKNVWTKHVKSPTRTKYKTIKTH